MENKKIIDQSNNSEQSSRQKFRDALIEARLRKSAKIVAEMEDVVIREIPFEKFIAKVMERKNEIPYQEQENSPEADG